MSSYYKLGVAVGELAASRLRNLAPPSENGGVELLMTNPGKIIEEYGLHQLYIDSRRKRVPGMEDSRRKPAVWRE